METAKLKGAVDSSQMTEALKDISIPVSRKQDGVGILATPVILIDPSAQSRIMTALPWGRGVPSWSKDEAADDSNKIVLAVPAGHIYDLKGLFVALASSATAGNRTVIVEIIDPGSSVTMTFDIGVTQAASLAYKYLYGQSVPSDVTGPNVSMGLFPILLTEGYQIRVRDSAAVDPAADDMNVYVHFIDYEA